MLTLFAAMILAFVGFVTQLRRSACPRWTQVLLAPLSTRAGVYTLLILTRTNFKDEGALTAYWQ